MTTETQLKHAKTAPKTSGLGLGGMGDLSALLDAPTASMSAGPLEIDLSLIDEDPHQPRTQDNPGFSDESIAELAASISLRGVKTPISIRNNPDAPGRYIVNHGARRKRGSTVAGKATIPAFIDDDYNNADQVVENLHRNDLTAREIADFIGRELAKGSRKIDIAKSISKSNAFISQHVALLDLPDPIALAFNSGRTRDVTVINELLTAHKKNPEPVADWLSDETQEITRGSVKLLRDFLEEKRKQGEDEGLPSQDDANSTPGNDEEKKAVKEKAPTDPEKLKKAIVQVEYDGRAARLMLDRRPPADGLAWLKYEDDGQEFEANLSQVKISAIIEG